VKSASARENSTVADKPVYGGQAVIEGVMMRGPRYFAVACRKPDGEILVQQEEVPAFFTPYQWARWPFLRGVFALADALVLGMKSLMFSANLAMEEEKKRQPPSSPVTQALIGPLLPLLGAAGTPGGTVSSIAITGSAVMGMVIGIGLFMLFPSLVAGWFTPIVGETIWRSVIEGVVRVLLVVGYIALIGRMKEVQRLFGYHGAEHKAINAMETEGVLDVDAAMRASRIHPRCGTNFVLTVLLVKALIFTILPWQNTWYLRLGLRLVMLPIVASLSYEVIRLAGKYRDVAPLQWLVLPGLLTQRLTTREPNREMAEVAVASLKGVIDREAEADAAKAPAQETEEAEAAEAVPGIA
jgi:uncharacterized protein YqhQ